MKNKSKKKMASKKLITIVIFCAILTLKKCDAQSIKILPPSNGYAGSKLNRAITKLTTTNDSVKKYVDGKSHHKPKTKNAETMFASGPAKAIFSSSLKSMF